MTWFTWTTPLSSLPSVSIDRERWETHIVIQHPDMLGREMDVGKVIENASHIVEGPLTAGTANSDYYLFLNRDVTSKKGTPLAVVVSPQTAQVRTAYFNRSMTATVKGPSIWPKS